MRFPKWPVHGERELELLAEVLDAEQWGGFHPMVSRFEQQFAAFQHCRFGAAAANGTITIEILLQALGIGPGDEVIVPSISFVSTATAVSRAGALPVFADIEPFSFQMSPDAAAAAITSKTKAILLVHFGGPPADVDRFQELAASRGLPLLEDAAHAQGSEWNGRRAGSFSLAASFSFQNGKVMTAGEGGMITTNDEALAAKLKSLINQGRRPGATFFHHFDLATNARLTAIQAAVLIAQLERLPAQIALRTRNAALLMRELAGLDAIRWQSIPSRVTAHSWYLVLGRVDTAKSAVSRDEFCRALTASGVPCTPFYPHALYQNPLYRQLPCRVGPCPNTEACLADAFWLPHRVLLADEPTIRELAAALTRALSLAPASAR